MIILSFVFAFIVMLVGFAFALMIAPPIALTLALSCATMLSLIFLGANIGAKQSFIKWLQTTSVA